jgi:hypothetical protein
MADDAFINRRCVSSREQRPAATADTTLPGHGRASRSGLHPANDEPHAGPSPASWPSCLFATRARAYGWKAVRQRLGLAFHAHTGTDRGGAGSAPACWRLAYRKNVRPEQKDRIAGKGKLRRTCGETARIGAVARTTRWSGTGRAPDSDRQEGMRSDCVARMKCKGAKQIQVQG